ncbi:MAG: glutamate--tRNA ligase, partial [Firmicutes bacterium]|nr:glutamate--tRNA ligase [Bacillota bacterium]
GPSPTGFIHLGNLYGAFVDERLAHQSGGTFFLRIDDTDDKRRVDGAVECIITSLKFFGVSFDEGAGLVEDTGNYGPYYQSNRAEIYQTYAKQMVQKGQAYPCFLKEDEIAAIRAEQEGAKLTPGIYGQWAKHRDLTLEEIESRINAGEEFVVRLKSQGTDGSEKTFTVNDAIRGELTMPENFQDTVILKSNGIPTYHFAHVVDDYLMRTTHVVRGEEWLPSLPIHVELFNTLGLEMPIYCHTAQLMKIDEETGVKRKLSKRKDPELSLDYYREKGYHPEAVREYLLTVLNSNFEEWRIANPEASIEEFEFTTEKMSNSGALFDVNKLNDVSKDVLLRIQADELAKFMIDWAKEFKPELTSLINADPAYLASILDIGRSGAKPRKDLMYAEQMFEFISFFFDDQFKYEDEVPENVPAEDHADIISSYLATYDHSDSQEDWFAKVRDMGSEKGYAAKPKDFKKNPDQYKGHVGHVSTVIRIALTGRANSPDIWEIQQILGEDKVKERMNAFINR